MKKEKYYAEPLEYVKGFTEFLGCKIDLSKKPLIPRPETEFWVQNAIKDILTNSSLLGCCNFRVLDIFAGSGCIGIAILKHVKNAKVSFADVENRMVGHKVVKSDVFSNIKGKFDYIFANPPYIPTTKKHKVQKSVLEFEPHKALFAGKEGLFFINKFLKDAQKFLNCDGEIFMEFDSPQKPKIDKLLKKYRYKSWEFHKDQYGKWRYIVIK